MPFPLEEIRVVARRHDAHVVHDVGIEPRQDDVLALDQPLAVLEDHHVVVEAHRVVRQMVVVDELPDHLLEDPARAVRAAFLQQEV